MKTIHAALCLLAIIPGPSYAAVAPDGDHPAITTTAPVPASSPGKPSNSEELSDAFLGDVSDGSKPASDGSHTEEESGDTMEQTLRTHIRGSL